MEGTLHFLTEHGTLVVFLVVLAEQIGLPVPAVPFLIGAGALVGAGQMELSVVAGVGIVAALIGDQVWFELGRRRGRQVLNWLCRISLEPTSCVRQTEEFFARYGMRSLIFAKFVPGFSTVAPPLAGIVGLRTRQYLLYNGAGTVLWVGSGIGLGYVFSNQLEEAVSMIGTLGSTMALILLGIVTGYVVYKVLHRYHVGRVMPRVSAREVSEKIAAGEEPIIIDLRSRDARKESPGMPGALPWSIEEVIARQRDLPRDRDVILYCACPQDAASVQASWRLRKRGLTRVWPLNGGIESWRAMTRDLKHAQPLSDLHTVAV